MARQKVTSNKLYCTAGKKIEQPRPKCKWKDMNSWRFDLKSTTDNFSAFDSYFLQHRNRGSVDMIEIYAYETFIE